MAKWVDATIPLQAGMTVWPGDAPFEMGPQRRIARGDSCNVSIVTMNTHTGTHVDAPWHFEDDGKRLNEVDPALFFGQALLIDVPNAQRIHAADLGREPLPQRILIKTRNALWSVDEPFHEDYVAIEADAASRMVDEGVKLVGVDYLSVAPFKQAAQETHHILLSNGVFIVEGLRLGPFEAGIYEFVVLPLHIHGADGAPCRAFIGRRKA